MTVRSWVQERLHVKLPMRSKLAERHDGALLGPGAHWPWPAERSRVGERRAGSGRGGLGGESGIFFNFGALPPKSDCQIGGNALLELRAPKNVKMALSPPRAFVGSWI